MKGLRVLALALAAALVAGAGSSLAQTPVSLRCESLRDAGLVLVPPSSPDYNSLLKDIQERLDHPSPEVLAIPVQLRPFIVGTISPEKRATSAILLNNSGKSIAALELVWRYEDTNGQIYNDAWANTFGKSVLLPFNGETSSLRTRAYWNTILPGSKRYLGERETAGDNTDVRKPAPDEFWNDAGGTGGSDAQRQVTSVKSITLAIDGVFFSDGEFVGPNQFGLWESVTEEAKLRMTVARAAHNGLSSGIPAAEILDVVVYKIVERPLMPRPSQEADATLQRTVAREIQELRQTLGDEAAVKSLAAKANTKLPDFRKR